MGIASAPPPQDDGPLRALGGASTRLDTARAYVKRLGSFELSALLGGLVILLTAIERRDPHLAVLGLALLTFGLMLFGIRVAQVAAARSGLRDALRRWFAQRERLLGDPVSALERTEALLAIVREDVAL